MDGVLPVNSQQGKNQAVPSEVAFYPDSGEKLAEEDLRSQFCNHYRSTLRQTQKVASCGDPGVEPRGRSLLGTAKHAGAFCL